MGDVVCNISLGRVAYYGTLPAANDGLVAVLLKVAQADAALRDHDTLAALLAAANTECDFTNYARLPLANVVVTVDDTAERVDVDCDPLTWIDAGGATNNNVVKLLICYDPDTTGGTDASIIPLVAADLVFTTDGSDAVATPAAAGFFGAS